MGDEMRNSFGSFAASVVLVLLASTAQAQRAGTVTFVSGEVTAERQPPVALQRGEDVLVSDAVVTAAASRAQLLFIDDAKLAIRPNSRIVIDEYVHAAATAAPGAVISSADDASVINLVKGGFRSITGAIGDDNPQNYEVRTAVGVLGIRGTDFAVLLCRADCAWASDVAAGSAVPDGLYIMVTTGATFFRNDVMTIDIDAGQFVFIPLDTRRPERLDLPPAVFIDDSDFRFEDGVVPGGPTADGQAAPPGSAEQTPVGFDAALGTRRVPETSAPVPGDGDSEAGESDSKESTPAQSIRGIDADGTQIDLTPGDVPARQEPGNRSISWSGGPFGRADATFSGVLDNDPGQYLLDGMDNLASFDNDYPGTTGPTLASFDTGTATTVESGADTLTVLRWGRWASGTAAITLADGSDASQNLDAQSLHWIAGPEWAAPPAMPLTGTADYTLVGSTSPTDSAGNTGILVDASFQADFLRMQVNSTLSIDIANFNWSATGSGMLGAAAQRPAHLFDGLYNVTITDPQGSTFLGDGQFSGFFSTPGPTSDPAFPGGVGLSYSLQDQGASLTISGAAAFGNP